MNHVKRSGPPISQIRPSDTCVGTAAMKRQTANVPSRSNRALSVTDLSRSDMSYMSWLILVTVECYMVQTNHEGSLNKA